VKVRVQGLVSTIPGDIPILFTGSFENISGQMWDNNTGSFNTIV
jgi:hypothetical protein